MPRYPALRAVLGLFICCMLVRHGSICVGVVEALSLDARAFLGKETCLLEGQVPYNAWLARALTLGVSRGVLIRHLDPFPATCRALAYLVGRLQKEWRDRCLFPITLPVTGG